MKSTLPFPTTPENTPNHPENRPSREWKHSVHSLLGKREGGEYLPYIQRCEPIPTLRCSK